MGRLVRDRLDVSLMSIGDFLAVVYSYLVDGLTTEPDLIRSIKYVNDGMRQSIVLRDEWGTDADEMDMIPPAEKIPDY